MANKPLKSIKFPGLPDTYTIEGLSSNAKAALLNCFAHVAWIDGHGQDYYDALEEALYGQPQHVVIPITGFTYGVPKWDGTYSIYSESQTYMCSNISGISFEAGDIIGIDDYETYLFQIGTNSTNAPYAPPYGTGWIQNGSGVNQQTEDYAIKAIDSDYVKCMMIRRVDRADLTQTDLDYINSHAHVVKVG